MKTSSTELFSTRLSTNNFFVEINSSFTLRNTPDRNGHYIVYLLLSKSGQPKKQINTNVKVAKKYWTGSRVSAKHPDAQDINLILANIESKITKIKVHWRLSEKPLSVQKLYEQFQSNAPDFDFISFCKHTLAHQQLRPATLKSNKAIIKKLEEYRPILPFQDLDQQFFNSYKKYLRVKKQNNDNTILSSIKVIKKYMNIAAKQNIKFGMQLEDLKAGTYSKRLVYLLPDEVVAIKKYFLSEYCSPLHKIPIAYFLTSCYTGMRISDIQQYKENLSGKAHRFEQVKTENSQFIKLNKEAESVLNTYPEFFTTKLSDQKINMHLKTIAKICKIEKVLSMHVGRHTFATTYIRNNGNVVKLQKLLGHSDLKSTMVYVHLVDMEAMEGLDDLITY